MERVKRKRSYNHDKPCYRGHDKKYLERRKSTILITGRYYKWTVCLACIIYNREELDKQTPARVNHKEPVNYEVIANV